MLATYEHDTNNRMFILRHDATKPTTRALNRYNGQRREFHYLTPRHKLYLGDYVQLGVRDVKYIHTVMAPDRQSTIMEEARRIGWNDVTFIYEPLPEAMTATNKTQLAETMQSHNDSIILSPNHTEAAVMLNLPEPESREACEHLTQAVYDAVQAKKLVMRCGKLGSFISIPQDNIAFWVDALHIHNQDKVVDVTGAGNAFLGGLAGGLNKYNDIKKAAACATISAGYTIEKDGLPYVTVVDGRECWNGRHHSPEQELDNFMSTRM